MQVLHSWFDATQEKKRKQARYASALEEYRKRLLRNGVTKWMEVAGDLSEMRQKYAAQRGAEVCSQAEFYVVTARITLGKLICTLDPPRRHSLISYI